MATSSVEICNSALIKLGARRISALSDDTKPAKLCNEQYDKLRKSVLRAHPWNFAVARKSLAKTANTPSFEFDNEFALGSDVLRVLSTNLLLDEDWQIEVNASSGAKVLVTNSDSVKIKYIKNITDTTIFSPDFEEALALRIASDLAYGLTQSRTLQNDMWNAFRLLVSEARSYDAQESQLQEIEANEWIDIRW